MHVLKSIWTLFVVLACLVAVAVAKSKEEEDEAMRDLYTGLAGLKEAASNPEMLAQLMRDLQVSWYRCLCWLWGAVFAVPCGGAVTQ